MARMHVCYVSKGTHVIRHTYASYERFNDTEPDDQMMTSYLL